LVLFAFFLVSCSATPNIVQITNTHPSEPGTQTPIPLADLDLESILIQPGDLPLGYSGGQVQDFLPGMFDDIPRPVHQIYQQFEDKNGSVGGVSVIVYDSAAPSIEAYDTLLLGMGGKGQAKAVESLGNQAHISGWNLLFLRCNTITYFRLVGMNYDEYMSYAQRLDERLSPLVCR